jgi:CRISPR-associated endonuclease/helicase Cas3
LQPEAHDQGILTWPGKSDERDRVHPTAYHMLDVGACALELGFPEAVEAQGEHVRNALAFLIAIHDLGKFSEAFRAQIETGTPPASWARHWVLSEVLFDEHDALLAELFGHAAPDDMPQGRKHRNVRRHLYPAAAWHHGRVPGTGNNYSTSQRDAIGEDGLAAAKAFLQAAAPLFGPMKLSGLQIGASVKRILAMGLPTQGR